MVDGEVEICIVVLEEVVVEIIVDANFDVENVDSKVVLIFVRAIAVVGLDVVTI